MTKKLTFVLLLFTSFTITAQESVLFKPAITPGKSYTMELKTNSQTEMNFMGDAETLAEMATHGVEMPVLVETESLVTSVLTTHSRLETGEIPATFSFGTMTNKTTVGGQTVPAENPYAGVKIMGRYDRDDKFIMDTIIGEKVTREMSELLLSTFESMQIQVSFPDEPLKPGDSFTDEVPMTLPAGEMGSMNMKINTEYTLKEIRGNKALFDLKQLVSLDMKQEQMNMEASGTGTGTAVFDLDENYIIEYTTVLPMDMTMKFSEEMTLNVKATTTTEQLVVIE